MAATSVISVGYRYWELYYLWCLLVLKSLVLLDCRKSGFASLNSRNSVITVSGITKPKWNGITKSKWNGITKSKWNGITKPKWNGITKPKWNGITKPKWNGITKPKWNGITKPKWNGISWTCHFPMDRNWRTSVVAIVFILGSFAVSRYIVNQPRSYSQSLHNLIGLTPSDNLLTPSDDLLTPSDDLASSNVLR